MAASCTTGASWIVRGYDGTNLIYERAIPCALYTKNQIQLLLQALTAKAGLSNDEIVGAYARKRSKLRNGHLEVQQNGPSGGLMCGSNPHFVAFIERKPMIGRAKANHVEK